jgi:hypothetical protein
MSHRTHLDLLAHADAMRAAARVDDAAAMHTALCSLHTDLVAHVRAERSRVEQLAPLVRDLVQRGQDELIELVGALLFNTTGEKDSCNCLAAARTLSRRLRRQAQLERAAGPAGPR